MRIANANPYSDMNSTSRKKPTTCNFVDLIGLLNIETYALQMGKDAIIVVLTITLQNIVENLRILIPTHQHKPPVNNVEKEDSHTDDVNQISADYDPDPEFNDSSDEGNCVSSADSTTLIESINLPVVFGNTATYVLVDWGSVCMIIN